MMIKDAMEIEPSMISGKRCAAEHEGPEGEYSDFISTTKHF